MEKGLSKQLKEKEIGMANILNEIFNCISN